MKYKRYEIADLLKRFLRGEAQDWEFDDFISTKITSDDLLEKYRKELANLSRLLPSGDPSVYTSQEGLQRIADIVNEIEASEYD